MYKKTVTYEDFDGNTVTEDFYFNFTKAELMELEVSEKDGFAEAMQRIIEANDGKEIIAGFKKILLLAIGKRVGNGFEKSDDIRREFQSSAAFSDIFMEFATDATAGAAFVNAVVPRALAEQVQAEQAQLQLKPEPVATVELPAQPEIPAEGSAEYDNAVRDLTDEQLQSMTQEELIAYFQAKNPQL